MKKSSIVLTTLIAITSICLVVAVWYMFGSGFNAETFKNGTTINGINVSNLSKEEAKNLVATKLINSRNDIKLTLTYQDKTWNLVGDDFEIDNQIMPYIENMFNYQNTGNTFLKLKRQNQNINISYSKILTGLNGKIDQIASEINTPAIDSQVVFDENAKTSFYATQEQNGVEVNKEQLISQIDTALAREKQVEIEIPTNTILPQTTKQQLEQNLVLRSSFSTNYEKSTADRKHNVVQALRQFNGMKIAPGEEVSFNQTTGPRSEDNGYKKANIILNGVYVEGAGGGVCQASTTLYNALILADLEILEVNKHSLPSSYVLLAFDAMVSEGYSDLRFKNNTDFNIYLKTWGDKKNVYVEVYGKPFEDGLTIERKADFVRAIPHSGDRIVPDSNGEYSDKVTFKGEYLRLKYPQEGYESKAYIVKRLGGEVIEEKLIRHEIYEPQQGIIIEGTEELYEGMTIPENKVKIIPPQQTSSINDSNVDKKLEKQNPSEFNP